MWKWLGGCLVVVIVAIAVASWWGFKAMRDSLAPDGSARVAVAATPARVFSSLSHSDSIGTWMAQGSRVTTSRKGALAAGDTLRIELRSTAGFPSQRMTWQVNEVVPDRLLVLRLLSDSQQPIQALRRDSLVAIGDSTMIISRIEVDTRARAGPDSAGKPGSPALGVGGEVMVQMLRMQAKLELEALKSRIERAAAPVPQRTDSL